MAEQHCLWFLSLLQLKLNTQYTFDENQSIYNLGYQITVAPLNSTKPGLFKG